MKAIRDVLWSELILTDDNKVAIPKGTEATLIESYEDGWLWVSFEEELVKNYYSDSWTTRLSVPKEAFEVINETVT